MATFGCFLAGFEDDDELLLEVGDGDEIYYCLLLCLELVVTLFVNHIDHCLKLYLFSRWTTLFLLCCLKIWLDFRLNLLILDPRHLNLHASVILLFHRSPILLLIARGFFFQAGRKIRVVYMQAEERDEVMMGEYIYPLRAFLQ